MAARAGRPAFIVVDALGDRHVVADEIVAAGGVGPRCVGVANKITDLAVIAADRVVGHDANRNVVAAAAGKNRGETNKHASKLN